MRKYGKIGTILLVFFLNTLGTAQERVDELIKKTIKEKNIPGFAYIVAKNGEVVKEGYHGLSNVELDVPVTEKSVFAIASMSKAYTATATLMLFESGLLQLRDKVKKYIPEAPESWNDITIWHLLTHTSGLEDDWGLYSWDESNEFFLKTQTDSAFLRHLFERDLKFKPGTNYFYSSGPFVLGIVIERITGKNYGEYLQQFIFNPLSLRETYVDHPYKIIPNRVSGYFNYDTTEMNAGLSGFGNGILISPIAYGRADVGIRTTARDLMKFYDALLTGKLLNNGSTKLMFSAPHLDNGDCIPSAPGWMNWPLAGKLISQHSGAFRTGFSSQAFLIPEENFIIILLSNVLGGTNFQLVQKIASTYYAELKQLSKRKEFLDKRPELTKQHLAFFKAMTTYHQSRNILSDNFPKSYFSDRLKKVLSNTESIIFLGEEEVKSREIELFGVRIYTLRYYKLIADRVRYTTVSLDKNNKVVFIDYPETE